MNRRRFLRVGAVGALAATAGCTKAVFGTNQGRVVSKAVRGGGEALISAGPDGVSARDDYPGNTSVGNVSVGDDLYAKLQKEFGNLTYRVTLEHYQVAWPNDASKGERKRYTTHRALFNQLQVGDSVTFQPDPTDTTKISSVSCITRNRKSLSERCSTGGEDSPPV